MGTHIVLGGVIASLIEPNMRKLMEDVEQGDFDFVLVRPADPQLLVSIRNFRLWNLIDVVVGAVVVATGFADLPVRGGGSPVSRLPGGGRPWCGGDVLHVADPRHPHVSNRQGRRDHRPFPGRVSGRPLAGLDLPELVAGEPHLRGAPCFAVTVPAETLSPRIDPSFLVVGLGITAAVVVITRLIWRANLAKYSGASG